MDKESFDLYRDLMLAFEAYKKAAMKEITSMDGVLSLNLWESRYEEAARKYADHAMVSDMHYAKWLRQNPDEPSYYDRVV